MPPPVAVPPNELAGGGGDRLRRYVVVAGEVLEFAIAVVEFDRDPADGEGGGRRRELAFEVFGVESAAGE